jgi:ABC-type multidrug transport system fused ATPase/permease subunit
MVLATLLALVGTALELLRPWPITWVVDHIVGSPDPKTITVAPVVTFAAIAFFVPVLIGYVGEQLELVVARISRKATVRIRSDVFEHIHRLDYAEHQQQFSGDLLMRLMGDVNMIRDLLFPSWVTLLQHSTLLIGSIVVFALVDWPLLAVAIIPLPFLAFNVKRSSAKVKHAATKQRRKEGAIASGAAESIRQVGIIKAFSAETRTADEFRSRARSAERASMAAARLTARMGRTTEFLTGAGVGLVLVVGAMRVRAGAVTTGELVLAIAYTRTLYKPVRKLTAEGARLAKATACALRVRDLLDKPSEDPSIGRPTPPLGGDIEFVNIHHRYPDGRRSLQEFSDRVPAGAFAVVTGENGRGKSTLLSLLLRLHRPTAGDIRIGGRSIAEYQLASYRDRIAYVPQQLVLFSGTIRQNIAFGNPGATGAEVLAAAEAALLLPVISRLPNGIDTELDEDGTSLSGGEARRVMLARAAVRRASLMLLDEPLVGLDPDARTTVIHAIRNIARDRTTLVVHHGDLDELAPDVHIDLDNRPALV